MALHSSVLTAAGVLVLAMGLSEAAAQTEQGPVRTEQGLGPSQEAGQEAGDVSGSGLEQANPVPLMPVVEDPLLEAARVRAGQEPGSGGDAQFPQMLKEAKGIQGKLDQLAEEVSHMLREARDASDVVQQMCLDDALNQVDVATQSAVENVASMASAAAGGDTTEVQRAYSVMQALGEGANALAAQASECVGERKKFAGGASLNVTVDPEIPRGDTTGGALAVPSTAPPTTVEIQPLPPSVSPVM